MTADRRTFIGLGSAAAISALLLFGRSGRAAPAGSFPVRHTPAQWQRILGPQRYEVLREAATERPFSSPLLNEHRRGTFVCAGCSNPLFSSATKFESGTGWPSFWKVLPGAICHACRSHPYDGTHRGALRPLRRPSRPRFRRRSQADGPALLHERPGPRLPPGLTF